MGGSRGPTGSAMRLRVTQGMSLEASIKADAAPPMGGWRAGVVVWGNGHSYNLRWFDGGPDSDRIPRKDVRPLPDPKIKMPPDLAAGDFVEVRHGGLWKCAEVMGAGAGAGGQFEVKIVGSTKVLSADRSALRPRMEWGEEKGWVLLHKGNQIPVESAVPPRSIAGKNMKGNGNGGSRFAMLGKTKRSNYGVEADIVRDVKRFQDAKFLAKEEPAARYHGNIEVEVMDVHPSLYLKKRQEVSNNKTNNEECDVVNGGTDSDSDSDDDSSNTSSDSSSSDGGSDGDSSSSNGSNNNSNGVGATPTTGQHFQENQEATTGQHCQENQEAATPPSCEQEEQDSDGKTESRASARMRHRLANEEEVVIMKQDQQVVEEHDHRVHGLELEAYLSVLKAFHVTGSLTWAKEELLSDLRIHLHVSSDEHLQAIWRLRGKK